MPSVQLPDGSTVTLHAKATISERQFRRIDQKWRGAMTVTAKMNATAVSVLGEEAEPEAPEIRSQRAMLVNESYARLSDEDVDLLNGWQSELISVFVASGIELPDDPCDLPKPVFDALAAACSAEFRAGTDFSVDGSIDANGQPDPKAGTTDSVG